MADILLVLGSLMKLDSTKMTPAFNHTFLVRETGKNMSLSNQNMRFNVIPFLGLSLGVEELS